MTILGLCVGMLPATIGAAARDVAELVELGIGFTPMIARLAALSSERPRQIESAPGCWGYIVRKLPSEDLQKILDEFHKATVRYIVN